MTGRLAGGSHHRRAYDLVWEFVHVAVDDATRLAYAEVFADEKAVTPPASCAGRSPSSEATASASSG